MDTPEEQSITNLYMCKMFFTILYVAVICIIEDGACCDNLSSVCTNACVSFIFGVYLSTAYRLMCCCCCCCPSNYTTDLAYSECLTACFNSSFSCILYHKPSKFSNTSDNITNEIQIIYIANYTLRI